MIDLGVALPLEILEKLRTGIYVYQEGRFIFVNKEIERISGYSREELLKIDPFDLLAEVVDRKNMKAFTDMAESGEFNVLPEKYVAKIRRKDGSSAWVELKAFPAVFNGKGAIVCNVVDITELVMEERRRKTIEKYVDLVGKIIRHDLANKISAAMNLLELSIERREVKLVEKAYDVLKDSVKSLKRLKNLEMLMKTGGELRAVSVREVFEETGKNYSIDVAIIGDASVMADDGLYSIADNLLNNAVKHGMCKSVRVVIESEEDKVIVRVEDDGAGIPDEIKGKIFNEGFHSGVGQGLGLFIVASLMDRYKGSVEVKDNEPSGTVFVLNFPLSV
ncbi:MAG: PAS domain-containing sensor histidine kinase [Archaeoglobus sp.]|uniref:ATP-binding protein n=1 Tax=Archaeoglobus sp. TaxID=1872626 RepID=UPI001DD09EA8|nr:PAS domain-containing sensor histidine kinase [Archaeoglobus sp.]MBO8180472.1 PAS domain-containing sensor histidine kinase [Archaeoglobus sp.]